jgi:spore coat protein U-like protein
LLNFRFVIFLYPFSILNLYLDASGTQIWGDGTGEGQLYVAPAPPPGSKVTIMIFGRIQPGQNATAGRYADDVQVILKN